MTAIQWYFDFVSPYAYLQSERLHEFDALAEVELKPVLLAGLLNDFGQKGPAEISPKRTHTYRHVAWLAHRAGVRLKLPDHHPFNPLPLLRLFVALGGGRDLLHRFFRFVWAEGHLPTDEAAWDKLTASLGIDDVSAETSRVEVKEALRANTEQAIARGVFGVPTLAVGKDNYWGYDATDMALDALRGDAFMGSALMKRASSLPDGVHRPVR